MIDNKAFQQLVKELSKISDELPATFAKTLQFHMKNTNCSVKQLSEASLLDRRTIQRMRNGKSLKFPSVIAICIGLRLPLAHSLDLVKKSGFSFKPCETHVAYLILLCECNCKDISIYDCNQALKFANIRPLVIEK